jgi:YHS domain-containing protein
MKITSEQAVDPVCGMTVDRQTASGSFEYQGSTYFFCNPHCLERFRNDPARFLKSPTLESRPQSNLVVIAKREYTCPMHPDIRANKPSSCPNCRMALEPSVITSGPTKSEYTCPMHPEIVRDAPGSCPICGMALEPKTVTAGEEKNEELEDMTRRFKIGLLLTIPLLVLAMSDLIPGQPLQHAVSTRLLTLFSLACNSGRVVGRLAVLRARLGFYRQSESQYVHLIAPGTGVAHTALWRPSSQYIPSFVSRARRKLESISKSPPPSWCWCCWDRSSSSERAARRAAQSKRCWAWLQERLESFAMTGEKKKSLWILSIAETGSEFARVKKYP